MGHGRWLAGGRNRSVRSASCRTCASASHGFQVNAPALELSDVCKRFGKLEILRGVNLTVGAGTCHAVIGPNGAGKSTLFDVICGRTRPDSGRVRLFGADISHRSPFELQRLGLARSFQRASTFARLSVFDNLRCAALDSLGHRNVLWRSLDSLDDAAARANAVLTQIGLARRSKVSAGELTYAEQRALDLGIALAGNTRLLLLDEPTAGMSRDEAASVIALIRTLKGDRTILIVEHDMEVVFGVADHVTVLTRGQVLATGDPERIYADARIQDAYFAAARPA
jgi:branched-chain amino acid transport system ATP-binding protein